MLVNDLNMKERAIITALELTGETIGSHDDKLILRAQKKVKATTKEGLMLEEGWKKQMTVRTVDGKVDRSEGYCRGNEPDIENLSAEEYDKLPYGDRATWKFIPVREVILREGVKIIIYRRHLDVIIADLHGNIGSRVKEALDIVVEAVDLGILKYTPNKEDWTAKNQRDAMRNRMLKYLRPSEYEWNLIITGDVGTGIYNALQADDNPRAVKYDGCIYTQGLSKLTGKTVEDAPYIIKYYDIGKRELSKGRECEPNKYYKLEITLRKEWFKKKVKGVKVNIGLQDMTTQPRIQEEIKETLVEKIKGVISLDREVLVMVAQAVELDFKGISTRELPKVIARGLLKKELTLTGRIVKLEADTKRIEQNQETLAQRIDRLEKASR